LKVVAQTEELAREVRYIFVIIVLRTDSYLLCWILTRYYFIGSFVLGIYKLKKKGEELMLRISKLEDTTNALAKVKSQLEETQHEKQQQIARADKAEEGLTLTLTLFVTLALALTLTPTLKDAINGTTLSK
jgi:hypothetical protein